MQSTIGNTISTAFKQVYGNESIEDCEMQVNEFLENMQKAYPMSDEELIMSIHHLGLPEHRVDELTSFIVEDFRNNAYKDILIFEYEVYVNGKLILTTFDWDEVLEAESRCEDNVEIVEYTYDVNEDYTLNEESRKRY